MQGVIDGGIASGLIKHEPNFPYNFIIQRQCVVCSRLGCPLKSHQSFARQLGVYRRKHSTRIRQIHDEKPDPFAKHPIQMTSELERFYAQGFLRWDSDFAGPERHLFPCSRFAAVFRHAWQDDALHYGVLSVVATQVSMLRSGTVDQTALKLQLDAISAQRRALERGEYSDARVMTALCIMSNAFASNNKQDLSDHMELISSWLEKRGGLHNLGMDGVLADNLMYGDHTRAIVYNQMPRYSIPTPPITSTNAPNAGPAYANLLLRGLISEEVASAAHNYVVLIKIFDRAAKGQCTLSEATYFAYLANVVEYQLACANATVAESNTLDECIVLACLVGNHSLLRNYGQLAPSVPPLEARLWSCFDNLRNAQFFKTNRLYDLECYIACICTLTSVRRTSPFEEQAVAALTQARRSYTGPVQAFYQLCDILGNYGWSESVCLTLYAKIWNKSSELLLIKLEEEIDGPT